MTQDISGFGTRIFMRASNTIPEGFQITQFADDVDAITSDDIVIADGNMSLNGDLVAWSKAAKIPLKIALIPGSDNDAVMKTLLNANRVGPGKASASDIIVLSVVYPDGETVVLTGGKIMSGPAANSVLSAGRKKTNEYSFFFEQ